MLKNVDPLLTGSLLSALDRMEPGQWLTLTAGPIIMPAAAGSPVIDLTAASTEVVVTALFSVLPLDVSEAPIVYLDTAPASGDLPDVVFAVCGLASDAERRPVPMSRLDDEDFARLAAQSVLTVRSSCVGDPAAFLLRKGAPAAR